MQFYAYPENFNKKYAKAFSFMVISILRLSRTQTEKEMAHFVHF